MTDSYTQVAARISDIVKTKFSREPSENASDAELEEIWHSTTTLHKSQARFIYFLFCILTKIRSGPKNLKRLCRRAKNER